MPVRSKGLPIPVDVEVKGERLKFFLMDDRYSKYYRRDGKVYARTLQGDVEVEDPNGPRPPDVEARAQARALETHPVECKLAPYPPGLFDRLRVYPLFSIRGSRLRAIWLSVLVLRDKVRSVWLKALNLLP